MTASTVVTCGSDMGEGVRTAVCAAAAGYGVRREAKGHAAFLRQGDGRKAVSSLRFTTALHSFYAGSLGGLGELGGVDLDVVLHIQELQREFIFLAAA